MSVETKLVLHRKDGRRITLRLHDVSKTKKPAGRPKVEATITEEQAMLLRDWSRLKE